MSCEIICYTPQSVWATSSSCSSEVNNLVPKLWTEQLRAKRTGSYCHPKKWAYCQELWFHASPRQSLAQKHECRHWCSKTGDGCFPAAGLWHLKGWEKLNGRRWKSPIQFTFCSENGPCFQLLLLVATFESFLIPHSYLSGPASPCWKPA